MPQDVHQEHPVQARRVSRAPQRLRVGRTVDVGHTERIPPNAYAVCRLLLADDLVGHEVGRVLVVRVEVGASDRVRIDRVERVVHLELVGEVARCVLAVDRDPSGGIAGEHLDQIGRGDRAGLAGRQDVEHPAVPRRARIAWRAGLTGRIRRDGRDDSGESGRARNRHTHVTPNEPPDHRSLVARP